MHPPKRGSWWQGTRPYVHRGFLRTWTANGLNQELVGRLERAIDKMKGKSGRVKLYVTGVSENRIALWQTIADAVNRHAVCWDDGVGSIKRACV